MNLKPLFCASTLALALLSPAVVRAEGGSDSCRVDFGNGPVPLAPNGANCGAEHRIGGTSELKQYGVNSYVTNANYFQVDIKLDIKGIGTALPLIERESEAIAKIDIDNPSTGPGTVYLDVYYQAPNYWLRRSAAPGVDPIWFKLPANALTFDPQTGYALHVEYSMIWMSSSPNDPYGYGMIAAYGDFFYRGNTPNLLPEFKIGRVLGANGSDNNSFAFAIKRRN